MRTYTTVTVIGERMHYYGRHFVVVRDEASHKRNRWTVWSVGTHEGDKRPQIVGRELPFGEAVKLVNELSIAAAQRAMAYEERDERWAKRNAAREKKMGKT